MEKIRRILEKKTIIFLIQFIILSTIIFFSGFYFILSFDSGITIERQIIIQFLANYVMFGGIEQFFFLLFTWLIITLVPVLILTKYWKAISMNLTTFFIPNFFFYVFLSRYSINFFNLNIFFLMLKTISLALIIIIFSLFFTFILKKVVNTDKTLEYRDLEQLNIVINYKCLNCGTEFNSLPKYCYKCLNIIVQEDNIKE